MAADHIPDPSPNALPKRGAIRERFEAYKDAALDSAMGKGESWAKKVGYGNQGVMLDDIPKLIDILGLKVVDKNQVCVSREKHLAYKALARLQLEQDWDEPE